MSNVCITNSCWQEGKFVREREPRLIGKWEWEGYKHFYSFYACQTPQYLILQSFAGLEQLFHKVFQVMTCNNLLKSSIHSEVPAKLTSMKQKTSRKHLTLSKEQERKQEHQIHSSLLPHLQGKQNGIHLIMAVGVNMILPFACKIKHEIST